VPGTLIGMYGGMLFAMRDSMAAGSRTLASATIFGAVAVLGVKTYNQALQGPLISKS
jgi:hypothetical protein